MIKLSKLWMPVCILLGALLAGCGGGGGGGTTGGGGGGGTFDASAFVGTFRGTWTNNTAGSMGPMSIVFSNTGGNNQMVVDLDGPVFGEMTDPPADTLPGTVSGTAATFTVNSTYFGPISFTVQQDGSVTGTASNVPNPGIDSVTFTGTVSATAINLTYVVNFTGGGTADGVMNLPKETGGGGGGGSFQATDFVGSYSGQWNNTTFGSSGNATIDIVLFPDTEEASLTMDLDGNVLGGGDPDPDVLIGPYDENGATLSVSSPTFGDLELTIDADGNVTGESTTLPVPDFESISFTGIADGNTIDLEYVIVTVDDGDPMTPDQINGTILVTKDVNN